MQIHLTGGVGESGFSLWKGGLLDGRDRAHSDWIDRDLALDDGLPVKVTASICAQSRSSVFQNLRGDS